MATVPNIKGLSFINRHAFLVERHGEAGLQQVLQTLRPETAHVLRTASAVDWHPLPLLIEIDQAIVDAFHGGDLAAARQIGEFNLDRAVSKVYKALMRLLDPGAALKRSAAVWGKIIQGGSLVATVTGPREADLRVVDLDPVSRIYCHVLMGGFQGTLHACGAKQTQVEHPECVLDGAQHCRFVLRW